MRTTLDLEDSLMKQLKRVALEQGKSLKEVVNESLSRALSQGIDRRTAPKVVLPSIPMGQPKVDLTRALQVAESLEDDAIADKLELRK